MSRLPFDAAKVAAARKAAADARAAGSAGDGVPSNATPGQTQISVTQLSAMVEAVVRDKLPRSLRVIGEISNFTDRTHWYFNLKDAGAVVSCVMFNAQLRKAGFVPAAGQEVVVTGFLDFYVPQGKLTFRVEKIEPVGAGALELAYRRLCEDLRAAGYFAAERKREVAAYPQRIAVITSRTGAALQDVLDTLRRRAPHVEVLLIDTLVQGAGAAPMVAEAINWVSGAAARLGIDTLIVTRGGGSMEDLWAFNERVVADAIFRCSIPVAAAIGHETDTTIAELVADIRCATPTQAAVRCTPDAAALREQIDVCTRRLGGGLKTAVARKKQLLLSTTRHLAAAARDRVSVQARRLAQAAARLEGHKPGAMYERRRAALAQGLLRLDGAMRARLARSEVAGLPERLDVALKQSLRSRRERLTLTARQLDLVGPASVLARGFSVTFGPDGSVLRRAEDVKPGQVIKTKVAEGTIDSTVNGLGDLGVKHGERRKRPAKREDPRQGGLFGE